MGLLLGVTAFRVCWYVLRFDVGCVVFTAFGRAFCFVFFWVGLFASVVVFDFVGLCSFACSLALGCYIGLLRLFPE